MAKRRRLTLEEIGELLKKRGSAKRKRKARKGKRRAKRRGKRRGRR